MRAHNGYPPTINAEQRGGYLTMRAVRASEAVWQVVYVLRVDSPVALLEEEQLLVDGVDLDVILALDFMQR